MSLDKLTQTSSQPDTGSGAAPARRSRAWLLPVALVLGFLAIIALLFGDRLLPAADVTTAPVITLRLSGEASEQAPAARTSSGPGKMIFQASGWIEPDPYIVYVPALTNGVVDEVKVLAGQQVKKGDLLATLIDDDARLDLREAEQKITRTEAQIAAHCTGSDIAKAELQAAQKKVLSLKAQLEEAEDNLRRLESIPAGAVPRQQVIQARLAKSQKAALVAEAETEIPRIQARLSQIEHERIAMNSLVDELETARDRAQLALDRTRIKAPMDGIVLHLHVAPGKKRMLNMDDPKSAVIVELYDPEHLQARIDVPLTEAAAIRIGQSVELVSDLLPDMTFTGKVTRISGEADLQRNTLQVKVAISNPDPRLRPEMLVRAKFFSMGTIQSATTGSSSASQSGRLALYAPESAIIDGDSVWVVSPENTAESRQVRPGTETRDGHRRILEGLKSGEHVILPPHAELKDGTRLNPSRQTSN